MTGLLSALDGLDIDIDLSVVGDPIDDLNRAISALSNGPQTLNELLTAAEALPLPPGLDGLDDLLTALTSLPSLLTFDAATALAPILAPITGLSISLEVTAVGRFGAIATLLREGIAIASGRRFGGPQGMPGPADLPQQEKPSLEQIRAAITDARATIQALGPSLRSADLFDHMLRAARGFSSPLIRFMPIPIIDDVMRPLATVESWRDRTGAELADGLNRTLLLLAEALDRPTTTVAAPLTAAAAAIATAPAEIVALLSAAEPDPATLAVAAERLRALAAALDTDSGPFAHVRELPNRLTHARLVAVRAVEPPMSLGPLFAQLDELVAAIPPVEADPLGPVAEAIAEFDLSALTDALGAIRGAVESALAAAEAGRETVRENLEALLAPADQAIAAATAALNLTAVTAALQALPAQLEAFLDTEVRGRIAPLLELIEDAVDTLETLAGALDPEELLAPVRTTLEDAGALINDPAVVDAFAQVERALGEALAIVEQIDLTDAADRTIEIMNEIEAKLAEIDPANIPDMIKPPLREAVSFLTSIDVQAEVSGPLEQVGASVAGGVGAALGEIERGLIEVQMRVEALRPSALLEPLAAPFADLTSRLEGFRPSRLLADLQGALDGLARRAHVLDAGAVLGPLESAHAALMSGLAQARPSTLLAPVEQALEGAVAAVLQASRFDETFDGLQEIIGEVQTCVALANDLRGVLTDAAQLLTIEGTAEQAVSDYVEGVLASLDPLDVQALAPAFTAIAQTNARNERARIASVIAPALRAADDGATSLANDRALAAAVAAAPINGDLQAAHTALIAALTDWPLVRDDIDEVAGALFERLLDYHQAELLEGGSVFTPFLAAPATLDALKAAIRLALEETVRDPFTVLDRLVRAVAPYLSAMAGGLAAMIAAAHAKLDAITGAEGVGGVVSGIEALVDQIRDFDLTPVTAPLDAVYARLEAGAAALSPAPLGSAISGANDAVAGLLDLDALIPASTVSRVDALYANSVRQIAGLDPAAFVAAELDPLFEDLMTPILPLFDLPTRLRSLTDAAVAALTDEVATELDRVEIAFDAMLRAIPLQDTGGPRVSASVSVSASVG